jgi:Domain of unknown function (DUF4328)
MSIGNEPHNPYQPPSVAVDPPLVESIVVGPGAYQSARGVAAVTKVFLYINAAVAALSMLSCIWAATSTGSMLTLGSYGRVGKALVAYSMLAIIELIARLACAIPFCIWFYRAYVNLLGLGNEFTSFKPGWAPGSFFIPFMNLVRPQQIAREIWMNSKNDEAATNTGIVNRWWAFWLAGNIISYIGSRFTNKLSSFSTGVWIGAVGDALLVGAAITGAIMVAKIEERQSEMAEYMAARARG